MAGRPKRTAEVTPLFLRIPPALLARVDRCQALLQLQTGVRYTRTMAVETLLGMGCAATEAGYEPQTIPAPHAPISRIAEIPEILKISEISQVSQLSEIAHAIEIEPEPVWDTPPPRPATPESSTSLPAHIMAIAAIAERYDKLSLRDLSQLLFDRDVYRATDRTTGAAVPVNRGTLTRWLAQARQGGVL